MRSLLTFRCVALIATGLLVTRSAPPASAQGGAQPADTPTHSAPPSGDPQLDDQRGFAHFTAGESHFAAERWADAAREFALAYEFSSRPEMLINLSRAHERGAQHAEALQDLELLLARHPETAYRAEAELRMSKLRALVEREQAPPAQTEPSIGAATLPETATPASSTAVSTGVPTGGPTRASLWPPRPLTLAIAAGALAVAVSSLATGLRAHRYYGDLEARCTGDRCEPGYERDVERGRALARASTGLTFGALALAGTTALLWYRDVSARRERVALAFGVERTEITAQVRGKF